MALPPAFLDELRGRVPLAGLIGRRVRLTRSGREHKGCCPFHDEKTPSFYVYDDHFHCFGCGEHGDAITFVMKSQGAAFMEAVQILAGEAGLEVPKASPAEAEREAQRVSVQEVLQAAAAVYQAWLFGPEGASALGYLRQRGLSEPTIRKFGLGWSGEGRGALAAALKRQAIAPERLVEAGLMKQGDHGPIDMFFSRVMFPIRDRRGAILSFSGRVLGDGQPKYVNGPETQVFSKRHSLFGLNFAREAMRRGAPLILVEGQMDVITLDQAGFLGAVAPLGTALTEQQLDEIWRLSPAPLICFDADKAGRRAALRAIELALPRLASDRSLKFLRLPEGQDPDSLIRGKGASAFSAAVAAAQPLHVVLYDLLADGVDRRSPEARAALKNRLIDASARIAERALAAEYRSLLLDRFFAERMTSRGGKKEPGVGTKPERRMQAGAPLDADLIRGRILTAILLAHPILLPEVEEAFALLDLPPECERLRAAFALFHESHAPLEDDQLAAYLRQGELATEMGVVLRELPSVAARNASPAVAAASWWHFFSLMRASRSRLREQRDELQRRHEENDPEIWARLIRLNAALRRAEEGEVEETI
jgi:DNA primase